jgi:ElaB/YqjD/DUF883 family membrane-anchored ribosome-binding protein
MSKTTGTDIGDLGTAAGILLTQNPKLSGKAMQQMLLDMMAQGHAGSMSIIDVAGQAGMIGSARSMIGGDVATNQRKLLGLSQLVRPEVNSPEEAATSIRNTFLQVGKKKPRAALAAMGVEFNEAGQIASPEQMIETVLTKAHTGGSQLANLGLISRIFEMRSGGIFRHLTSTYNEAGGGAQGLAAVRKEMSSVTQATTTPADLESQFEQLLATPAEKFNKALNEISETVAMRLEPILTKLADKLESNKDSIERFMKDLVDLGEWLVENPWQGLGAAVSLAITKELAGAAIGATVSNALKTAIGGSVASGLTIAAASIAITQVGMMVIDLLAAQDVKKQEAGIADAMGGLNQMSELSAKTRAGKVTPEDIKKAEAEVNKLQDTANRQQQAAADVGKWSPLTGMLGPMLGGDRARALEGEAKTTTDTIVMMRRAIELATKAIQAHGAAISAAPDPARHMPIASPGRS